MNEKAKKVSLYGMLLALSMVLSYVEALLPINLGVPGIKLGLPNIVTVFGLYTIGSVPTVMIGFLRIVLVAAMFGNMMTFAYSFCGFLLSLSGMLLLQKIGGISRIVISMTGGVLHNIGQLMAAIFLLRSMQLLSYLALLLPAGVVSGAVIGLLAGMILLRVQGFLRHAS